MQGRKDLQSVQDLVAGDGVPSTDRKLETVRLDLEHGVPSFVEVELRDAAIDDSFERLKEFFLESGRIVSLNKALCTFISARKLVQEHDNYLDMRRLVKISGAT